MFFGINSGKRFSQKPFPNRLEPDLRPVDFSRPFLAVGQDSASLDAERAPRLGEAFELAFFVFGVEFPADLPRFFRPAAPLDDEIALDLVLEIHRLGPAAEEFDGGDIFQQSAAVLCEGSAEKGKSVVQKGDLPWIHAQFP